jgi:hypothetical protein
MLQFKKSLAVLVLTLLVAACKTSNALDSAVKDDESYVVYSNATDADPAAECLVNAANEEFDYCYVTVYEFSNGGLALWEVGFKGQPISFNELIEGPSIPGKMGEDDATFTLPDGTSKTLGYRIEQYPTGIHAVLRDGGAFGPSAELKYQGER